MPHEIRRERRVPLRWGGAGVALGCSWSGYFLAISWCTPRLTLRVFRASQSGVVAWWHLNGERRRVLMSVSACVGLTLEWTNVIWMGRGGDAHRLLLAPCQKLRPRDIAIQQPSNQETQQHLLSGLVKLSSGQRPPATGEKHTAKRQAR